MIDAVGIVVWWVLFGAVILGVVALWRPELRNIIKANIPGYGLTWRIAVLFICAILAFLWPVVLFAAVKRAVRDARPKEEK